MSRIRTAFAVLVLVVSASAVHGQASVSAYNIRRERVTLTAMTVLASWSAVNMAAGTSLSLTADDPQRAAFHQMNAGWGIINAALAVPSLIGARSRLAGADSLGTAESLLQQNRLEDILLFNAGIDVAYIAAGFYLTERARRGGSGAPQLAGFGAALMVQGGFLFVFDLVVYAVQRSIGRELDAFVAGRADLN